MFDGGRYETASSAMCQSAFSDAESSVRSLADGKKHLLNVVMWKKKV